MPNISFFTTIADKSPRSIPLERFYNIIKNKTHQKCIEKIRAATDKAQVSELKKGLPAVTLSGVFKGGHKAEQLVERSGLMQIDFDGVGVEHVKQTLMADPYTVMAFVSPGGKGVKGVVKYEGDHLQAFNALRDYYAEKYGLDMDKSCKDICRLCFLSHDPQAFYRPEAPVFIVSVFGLHLPDGEEPQAAPPAPAAAPKPATKNTPAPTQQQGSDKSAAEKVQNICANIAARGVDITGTYDDWLKCGLALANEFGEAGRDYFHAVSRNNPSYKPEDTDRKFNNALKGSKTVTIAYFFARAQGFGLMEKSQRGYTPPVPVRPAEPVKEYTPEEIKEMHSFYKPKFNKYGEFEGVKFNRQRFLNILVKLGISVFCIDANTFKFVRVDENRLEEISIDSLPSIFQRYIFSLPPAEVECTQYDSNGNPTATKMQLHPALINEHFLANLENLFNKKMLMLLTPPDDYRMFEDTKHEKFFFYRNGVACVTKEGATFKRYADFDKHIWKNQLLQREYREPDEQSAVFEQYVNLLSVVREADAQGALVRNEQLSTERFHSLCSIIGYNLHSFFATKLFATNLTDSRMDENGEANGRSGKTLLVRGLGRMLNADKASSVYVELGGKTFDVRDKHRYENCSIDTRLVHLNDVPRYFKIEPLFNDITDGMRAKKLYEGTFTIHTKMIISSNKSLWIDGDSAKDRMLVFEVSDYFSAKHSPENEFRHWFFEDWDADEWARFDTFMHRCCQLYLANGIMRAASINIEKRMLRDHTHPEFVRWMDYRFAEQDDEGNVNDKRLHFYYEGDSVAALRHEKKTLFEEFRADCPDFLNAKFTQAKFTQWLKIYVDKTFKDVKLVEQRSNGRDYVYFLRSR